MANKQEMIEVLDGLRSFVVPKESEQYVRKMYYGKPAEKRLIIRPHPYKPNEQERAKLLSKLESYPQVIHTAPAEPEPVVKLGQLADNNPPPIEQPKRKPGRPRKDKQKN